MHKRVLFIICCFTINCLPQRSQDNNVNTNIIQTPSCYTSLPSTKTVGSVRCIYYGPNEQPAYACEVLSTPTPVEDHTRAYEGLQVPEEQISSDKGMIFSKQAGRVVCLQTRLLLKNATKPIVLDTNCSLQLNENNVSVLDSATYGALPECVSIVKPTIIGGGIPVTVEYKQLYKLLCMRTHRGLDAPSTRCAWYENLPNPVGSAEQMYKFLDVSVSSGLDTNSPKKIAGRLSCTYAAGDTQCTLGARVTENDDVVLFNALPPMSEAFLEKLTPPQDYEIIMRNIQKLLDYGLDNASTIWSATPTP